MFPLSSSPARELSAGQGTRPRAEQAAQVTISQSERETTAAVIDTSHNMSNTWRKDPQHQPRDSREAGRERSRSPLQDYEDNDAKESYFSFDDRPSTRDGRAPPQYVNTENESAFEDERQNYDQQQQRQALHRLNRGRVSAPQSDSPDTSDEDRGSSLKRGKFTLLDLIQDLEKKPYTVYEVLEGLSAFSGKYKRDPPRRTDYQYNKDTQSKRIKRSQHTRAHIDRWVSADQGVRSTFQRSPPSLSVLRDWSKDITQGANEFKDGLQSFFSEGRTSERSSVLDTKKGTGPVVALQDHQSPFNPRLHTGTLEVLIYGFKGLSKHYKELAEGLEMLYHAEKSQNQDSTVNPKDATAQPLHQKTEQKGSIQDSITSSEEDASGIHNKPPQPQQSANSVRLDPDLEENFLEAYCENNDANEEWVHQQEQDRPPGATPLTEQRSRRGSTHQIARSGQQQDPPQKQDFQKGMDICREESYEVDIPKDSVDFPERGTLRGKRVQQEGRFVNSGQGGANSQEKGQATPQHARPPRVKTVRQDLEDAEKEACSMNTGLEQTTQSKQQGGTTVRSIPKVRRSKRSFTTQELTDSRQQKPLVPKERRVSTASQNRDLEDPHKDIIYTAKDQQHTLIDNGLKLFSTPGYGAVNNTEPTSTLSSLLEVPQHVPENPPEKTEII